ncbi:hypothetical protein FsymDg_1561 [Candidatus Protofrankia datiscae]|uniref:Uncharacterized protein n=1 Tax=Candidatus Protofrankia datiscae TaxID=2716812 RepID=F8B3S6_9ACTN|nr:hypothetical protein [Candidatus Protofrankia datiscae]AEH09021.1 hypothetical protein FsymDg_1561 [Candidatus Protofrankia datiscae]
MAGLLFTLVVVVVVLALIARTLYMIHRDDPGPIETRGDYDTRRPSLTNLADTGAAACFGRLSNLECVIRDEVRIARCVCPAE